MSTLRDAISDWLHNSVAVFGRAMTVLLCFCLLCVVWVATYFLVVGLFRLTELLFELVLLSLLR